MANPGLPKNLLGIIFIVVGAGLGIWAYQQSEGLESQLSSTLTGSHSDNVMMLAIGCAASLAIGIFLVVKK